MNCAALIKFIKNQWDNDEELVDLVGELHGVSRIASEFELPYARISVESDDYEYTGMAFLPFYSVLIAVYSVQGSELHHTVGRLITKLFRPCDRECIPEENPETYMRILHSMPVSHKLDKTDATLAGRDVLVSTFLFRLFVQEDCIPDTIT